MAHQAHNIPWTLLSSNLQWSTAHGITNLRPRMKPNQGKEITHFIEAFIRNINDHSETERKKYAQKYEPTPLTDYILDEAVVQKITPTVRKWRSYGFNSVCPSDVCRVLEYKEQCQCIPIPDEERKAAAFVRPEGRWRCYRFFAENRDAFFNLEVVKTLLLHGEMDAILRACALPGIRLQWWWQHGECQCGDPVVGWDQVCIKAVRAYICLNMVYCFPKIWDEESGRSAEMDYRNSKFYQYTLRTCTGTCQISEVSTYPHRQFFGIGDDQFKGDFRGSEIRSDHWLRWTDKNKKPSLYSRTDNLYGKVPIDEFLTLENDKLPKHQPGKSDVTLVQDLLYRKGLPAELVLEVMQLADYKPVGRLCEPRDPFHPSNRNELSQYLTYCWQVLVRCDMIAKALGMDLPWKEIIADCIVDFWADDSFGKGRFFWTPTNEHGDWLPKVFVDPHVQSE